MKTEMNLDAILADVCLPCYWSGHHLPVIQVPVYNGMALDDLKDELHSEINQGAINIGSGNDQYTENGYDLTDEAYKAFHAAIDEIEIKDGGDVSNIFPDLEIVDEYDDFSEGCYAFFVISPKY